MNDLSQFTGKEGAANFAALVAQEQARIDGTTQAEKHEAFVSEQPGAIPQDGNGVDQQALTALQEWRQANPSASSAQLAHYEASLVSVMQGRRHDETLTQFQARTKGSEPAPVSEQQTVAGDHGIAAHLPDGVEAEDVPGLNRVLDTASSLGIEASTVNAILSEVAKTATSASPLAENYTGENFELYGYTLSPPEIAGEGFQLDRYDPQLQAACKLARQRGIGQEVLVQMMRAYFQSES